MRKAKTTVSCLYPPKGLSQRAPSCYIKFNKRVIFHPQFLQSVDPLPPEKIWIHLTDEPHSSPPKIPTRIIVVAARLRTAVQDPKRSYSELEMHSKAETQANSTVLWNRKASVRENRTKSYIFRRSVVLRRMMLITPGSGFNDHVMQNFNGRTSYPKEKEGQIGS